MDCLPIFLPVLNVASDIIYKKLKSQRMDINLELAIFYQNKESRKA
jgi:hypothetical protein